MIGLTGFLFLLVLLAAAGASVDVPAGKTRLYVFLGAAACVAVAAVLTGRRCGWQTRRALMPGWPLSSLLVIMVVGYIDSQVTRGFPGTITIAFAYTGLTCGRWRSLALLPLGVWAFIVGGAKELPAALLTVVLAAVMWVLISEVPAWLVAQLEHQSALLRKIAQTDPLTQLLNRSTLAPRLSTYAASGSVVVLIDLDNFKRYNDNYGHRAGDQVLVSFAEALRSSVRKEDIIFRIGGDEFLLMLVGADQADAEQVLGRLRERCDEVGMPVGFSAGVAVGQEDLLGLADEQMYATKRSRGEYAD